jgi:hypothetical protein
VLKPDESPKAEPDTTPPPPKKPPKKAPPPPPSSSSATKDPNDALPKPDSDEKKKSSGAGISWVYLMADAGFMYSDMAGISSSNLGVTKTAAAGPTFGFGGGIRLLILTLGAQANVDTLSSFDLWRLDAVLGIHIPIGHVEPSFGLHGGYCFVGSLDQGISQSPSVSITGGDAGLQLGLDYYFNHYISLGLEGSANLLFLHRPVTALPSDVASHLTAQEKMEYGQTGDSVGVGVGATLHLGLHL